MPTPSITRLRWSAGRPAHHSPTSAGGWCHTFMIPDAIVSVDVAASRLENGPKRSPPRSGIHAAVYPIDSSSAARAAASAASPKRSSPDHTPVPVSAMAST